MRLKPHITIRTVLPADAADAAILSAELGYPVATEDIAKRLSKFSRMDNHSVFGAYVQDRLIGWIDVGIVHHLQSEPYGEIGGLIVTEKYHSSGIGKALIETAEKWVAGQNLHKLLVRSQIAREGAHAFYIRQNFVRTKTSAVFTKTIDLLQPCAVGNL